MGTVRNVPTDSSNSGISTLNKSLSDLGGTLLYTKFMIPGPSLDCIDRIQLISRLEEIMNKKLTLISAPAGYGKTTLLSRWLLHKGTSIQTAWVSLDEKDNNLHTFWKYILTAIEKSSSGAVENYESVDCSIMEYPMDILLNGLMNRLSDMNDVIVLVLDNYHVIYEESIHDSLQYFINHLPLNVHVVITSRSILPLKLSRLRSHGDLLELKTEDLKLNFSEISEFLTRTMKLCMDESEVRKLEEWTEGWIVALNLAALTVKSCSDVRRYLNDYRHINYYIFEYMSEEVFNLLKADLKDFLLKTSILDTLNSTSCNAVVGINNSQEIINILVKNNIFINALDNKKNNYRYHSLFADFLKGKLMEVYPDIVGELYLRVSRCYEENNMIKEALDYSIRSNNHQNTARLIEKYGEIMIISRDLVRITSVIESLPEHLILNSAKICALYTMSVAGKNASENNGICIGNLFVSFKDNVLNESKEELLLIRTILSYANEDFKTALEYGNQMLKRLSKESVFKCLFYKIIMQIYCAIGDSEKCEYYLDLYIDAIRKKDYDDELFVDISYTNIMVNILCGIGKYKRALEILIRFEEKLNSYNIHLPAMANCIYLNLGYLYYEFGELELSSSSMEKCIEISSIKTDFFRLARGYVLAARISQKEGKYDVMMKFIKKVDSLCDKNNAKLIMNNLIIYIIRTLLLARKMEYVEYLIQKYEIEVKSSYDISYEEVHLALADLYIVNGKLCKSEEILNKLYEEIIGTNRNLRYVRIMILKSLLSKCKGNEVEAVKYMKDAIERASEQGYISTFSDFGTPMAEIICKLLSNKEQVGFIAERDIDYALRILSHIKEPKRLMFKGDMEIMNCLSKREFEVLKYIYIGLTNSKIASKLYIAECTVKKHINNIYAKIGVVNRDQAMQFCEKLNQ